MVFTVWDKDRTSADRNVLLKRLEKITNDNTTILQYWNDCRLTWNETAHGGIKVINVKEGEVWVPDIVLYDR